MRRAPLPALALASALLGACVEPGQYGGPIAVDPTNVQARLRTACGIRGPSAVCEALAEPDEDAAPDPPR